MKWILLQKWSRFVPFFFTPFLELNLLLENNSALPGQRDFLLNHLVKPVIEILGHVLAYAHCTLCAGFPWAAYGANRAIHETKTISKKTALPIYRVRVLSQGLLERERPDSTKTMYVTEPVKYCVCDHAQLWYWTTKQRNQIKISTWIG